MFGQAPSAHCFYAVPWYKLPMNINRPRSMLHFLRQLALVATLLCTFPLVTSGLFYQTALLNEGTVLDFAPNSGAFQPESTPVLAFTDYMHQKHIATPQSALGAGAVQRGDVLRLRYDPENPENFRLDTPLGMWGVSVIILLCGLLPFLLLHLLVSAQRQRGEAAGPVQRLR